MYKTSMDEQVSDRQNEAVLLFTGDVRVIEKSEGAGIALPCLDALRAWTEQADLCVTAVDGGPGKEDEDAFMCTLAEAGIDVLLPVDKSQGTLACRYGLHTRGYAPLAASVCPSLYQANDIVVGVLTYDCVVDEKSTYAYSIQKARQDITLAKEMGAEFILVQLICEGASPRLDVVLAALQRLEVGYVICTDAKQEGIAWYREVEGKATAPMPVLYGLGSLYHGESILLWLRLHRTEQGIVLAEEYYIPFYTQVEESSRSMLVPLLEGAGYDALRRISTAIWPLKDQRHFLSLGKLLDSLDQTMPTQYEGLAWQRVRYCFCQAPGVADIEAVRTRDVVLFVRSDEEIMQDGLDNCMQRVVDTVSTYGDSCIFVFSPVALPEEIAHVVCSNPMALYAKLSGQLRGSCGVDFVVALLDETGSDTAQTMVASVLSERYRVLENEPKQPEAVGRAFQRWDEDYTALIQPIHGGLPESVHMALQALQPDVLIHVLKPGKEQKSIADLPGVQTIPCQILNVDAIKQEDTTSLKGCTSLSLKDPKAACFADGIAESEDGLTFRLHEAQDDGIDVALSVQGRQNVYNAMAAFAVGRQAEIEPDAIVEALQQYNHQNFVPPVMQVGSNWLYIDEQTDAKESYFVALERLRRMRPKRRGRRIAVLADMPGQGANNRKDYQDVASAIGRYELDYLFCLGTQMQDIVRSAKKAKLPVVYGQHAEEIAEGLQAIVQPDDMIVFKGGKNFILEKQVIDDVFGTCLFALRGQAKTVRCETFTCRVFDGQSVMIHSLQDTRVPQVVIPFHVGGVPVVSLGPAALKGHQHMRRLVFPSTLRSIQPQAVSECTALPAIVIPGNIALLHEEAFYGCTTLTEAYLYDGVRHIGERCFAGNTALQKVVIPGTVQYIADDAFEGCDGLQIMCPEGSYAHRYAIAQGLEHSHAMPSIMSDLFLVEGGKNLVPRSKRFIAFRSENTMVAAVLYNGEVLGYDKGNVKVYGVRADGTETPFMVRVYKSIVLCEPFPLLANRFNKLPDDFKPSNLVLVDPELCRDPKKVYLEARTNKAFEQMVCGARTQGVHLQVKWGYRSLESQRTLYNRFVETIGQEAADARCVLPGFSEHHVGLVMDITNQVKNKEALSTLPEVMQWIGQNCWAYGFTLTNLEGKKHITGTQHEPWHVRYIGDTKITRFMHEQGLTLMEYLAMLSPLPQIEHGVPILR